MLLCCGSYHSRRYASLYFVFGVDRDTNELITLESIHKYVLTLDRYFENVCELDIIYGFDQVRGSEQSGRWGWRRESVE